MNEEIDLSQFDGEGHKKKDLKIKIGKMAIYTNVNPMNIPKLTNEEEKVEDYQIIEITPKTDYLKVLETFFQEYTKLQKKFAYLIPLDFHVDSQKNIFRFRKTVYADDKKLFRRIKNIKEIKFLVFFREICRFYYCLINENQNFLKLLIDNKLKLAPFCFKNIYLEKGKEKMSLIFDFVNFLGKDEEIVEENDENFHLDEFRKLILKSFLKTKLENLPKVREKLEKRVKNMREEKKLGFITNNLINNLFKKKNGITWNILFQNPALRIDIFLTPGYCKNIWEINPKIDKEIQAEWIYSYYQDEENNNDHNDYNNNKSEDEKIHSQDLTEKRKKKKKSKQPQEDGGDDVFSVKGAVGDILSGFE